MNLSTLVVAYGWTFCVLVASGLLAMVRIGGLKGLVKWMESHDASGPNIESCDLVARVNQGAHLALLAIVFWAATALLQALRPSSANPVVAALACFTALGAMQRLMPFLRYLWQNGWVSSVK